jgi:hypothetical protein
VRNLPRAIAGARPASGVYIDWWGVKSWTGLSARFALSSAATVPREHDDVDSTIAEALSGWRTGVRSASTTTLTLCYYGAATPSTLSVVRGLPTGYEADAELIYVTGREKMQVVDHPVVTAHE